MASGGDDEEDASNGTAGTKDKAKIVYKSLTSSTAAPKAASNGKGSSGRGNGRGSAVPAQTASPAGSGKAEPRGPKGDAGGASAGEAAKPRKRRPKEKERKKTEEKEGQAAAKNGDEVATLPLSASSAGSAGSPLNPTAVPFTPSPPASASASAPATAEVTKTRRAPVARPNPLLGKGAPAKLKAEVEGLRRRYQACGPFACTTREANTVLTFLMPVEDPDFPFDVSAIKLCVTLPPKYPDEGHATFALLNDDIPAAVKARIQNRMDDASEGMPRGELNVKPLLRVLERNLEKWMVALPTVVPSGASSSIKIIPAGSIVVTPAPEPALSTSAPTQQQQRQRQPIPIPADRRQLRNGASDEVARSLEMFAVGVPIRKAAAARSRYQPPDHVRIEPISASAVAGTVKMEVRQLRMDNIALVVPVVLGVSLRCGRCRKETAVADLRPDVDRIVPCVGCRQHMEVSYIRDAIHGSSRVLGYLRCKRTTPMDLLPSTLQVSCSECDPTEPLASSIKIEGVQVGEDISFACRHCHEHIGLCFGGITWSEIPALMAPAEGAGVKAAKLPTKIGEALPEYGACSHYRKSHRWFRFPCCGRAYPCDDCHAAEQTHPAEWATRQICGFCSREFSTSQRYCECGETPGAARTTAHWEGGKGTRDQSMMSRKDRKKYRNQEKTISSKARDK